MPFFSNRMRELMKHAVGMLIIAVVILACAIALTFVIDWMRQTDRPPWLISGAEFLSVVIFVADGIAIIVICFKVIIEAIRDLF
jgi:hypothetical protein